MKQSIQDSRESGRNRACGPIHTTPGKLKTEASLSVNASNVFRPHYTGGIQLKTLQSAGETRRSFKSMYRRYFSNLRYKMFNIRSSS